MNKKPCRQEIINAVPVDCLRHSHVPLSFDSPIHFPSLSSLTKFPFPAKANWSSALSDTEQRPSDYSLGPHSGRSARYSRPYSRLDFCFFFLCFTPIPPRACLRISLLPSETSFSKTSSLVFFSSTFLPRLYSSFPVPEYFSSCSACALILYQCSLQSHKKLRVIDRHT